MIFDFRYFSNIILKQWKLQIKDLISPDNIDNMEAQEHIIFINNFNFDLGDDMLHLTLNLVKSV